LQACGYQVPPSMETDVDDHDSQPNEAALYIISQIIGAVIGAAVVSSIFGSSMSASVTLPSDGNVVRAFVL
jgi:hypothetical protein